MSEIGKDSQYLLVQKIMLFFTDCEIFNNFTESTHFLQVMA